MLAASDFADWWDRHHKESQKALDELVDTYPNWFGVTVATFMGTAMELGAGMVDVLRLGEGLAEGGVKGVAKDALRLLQFAPAVGKLSRFALARVLTDPGGGICTWISAAKALRQVGVKAFAAVDDLAQAAGFKSISSLGGAFVDEVTPILKKLGARVTDLSNINDLGGVAKAIKGDGAVMFSVEWDMGSAGRVGHTIYAFLDSLRRVKLADRTGAVVSSLAELERFYPGISKATVYGSAALVEGPRILISKGVAVLALEIRSQLIANPETVAQTFEVIKRSVGNAKPADHSKHGGEFHGNGLLQGTGRVPGPLGSSRGPIVNRGILGLSSPGVTRSESHHAHATGGNRYHVVKHGDWLSKIALHYYHDMYKWPLIYSANRRIIGKNPNLIFPGQRLWIPPLVNVTAKSESKRESGSP